MHFYVHYTSLAFEKFNNKELLLERNIKGQ